MDVTWPVATVVIVLGLLVAFIALLVATRDNRTKDTRVGFFISRERFAEPPKWPGEEPTEEIPVSRD